MAQVDYDESLSRLLKSEGGYTNHPKDPGGLTNFGITIADYRRYVDKTATAIDIRNMKLADAKSIYRAKYWDAQRCGDLPAGLDYSTFDYGVNSGNGRSGKVLRRVLGMPDNTSVINDAVLAAVAKRDPKALIMAMNDERLRFLQHLGTWSTFGKGWGARVASVKAVSLHMAEHGAVVAPTAAQRPITPAPTLDAPVAKGIIPPPPPVADIILKGGAAQAPVSGGLVHYLGAHPLLTTVAMAGGVAVVIAGAITWHHWHDKTFDARQEAPTPGLVPVPELKAA